MNVSKELSLQGNNATVHVFKIEITSCYNRFEKAIKDVTTFAEQEKASRFLDDKDKKRYLVTRFALRSILSSFVDLPAEAIIFHTTSNRKPAVHGIEFNVAHSGNLLLIAVGSQPVGIDIEFVNPSFNYESIFPGAFSEVEQFEVLHSEDPLMSFYRCWTRKEAVLKATGEGLIDDIIDLVVTNDIVQRNNQTYNVSTFPLMEDHYIFSLASESDLTNILFWKY